MPLKVQTRRRSQGGAIPYDSKSEKLLKDAQDLYVKLKKVSKHPNVISCSENASEVRI